MVLRLISALGLLAMVALTRALSENRRRAEIVDLGVKSRLGGTLASFIIACVAGMPVYE
jgi:nucleoside permease NupC